MYTHTCTHGYLALNWQLAKLTDNHADRRLRYLFIFSSSLHLCPSYLGKSVTRLSERCCTLVLHSGMILHVHLVSLCGKMTMPFKHQLNSHSPVESQLQTISVHSPPSLHLLI